MPTCFIVNLDDDIILAEIYGEPRSVAKSFLDGRRKEGNHLMIRELEDGDYQIVENRKINHKIGNRKVIKSEWIPAFLITTNKPEVKESPEKNHVKPSIYIKPIVIFIGMALWAALNNIADIINRNNKF